MPDFYFLQFRTGFRANHMDARKVRVLTIINRGYVDV